MMSEKKSQDLEKSRDQIHEDLADELPKKKAILYSALVAVAITVCIFAMVGINLFVLLIIIGIVIVYVYFDEDIRKGDSTDIINTNDEKE